MTLQAYKIDWVYWSIPINPTGRWKLETGPYYTDKLFIEHRSRFFLRSWIDEDNIKFRPAISSEVFTCSTK